MSKRTGEAEIADEGQESKRVVPGVGKPINLMQWIEDNKASFKPPVCNKLMYGAGQLKIMCVGGPNTRKDYHIEEGEELFYQIKGDMCLKVLEKGKPRDIPIKEGEMFLLPRRIHHSPQRLENTVGLVIERERLPDEYDGLRYFCEDGVSVLWETWFHCVDLGTQLVPVIKEYFASEPHKTGKPDPENIWGMPPLEVDIETELKPPFPLKQWLNDNEDGYKNGSKELSADGEIKVHVHGAGLRDGHSEGETWLWQMEGKASVTVGDVIQQLEKNDVINIPANSEYKVKGEEKSVSLSVIMVPKA